MWRLVELVMWLVDDDIKFRLPTTTTTTTTTTAAAAAGGGGARGVLSLQWNQGSHVYVCHWQRRQIAAAVDVVVVGIVVAILLDGFVASASKWYFALKTEWYQTGIWTSR